MTLPTEPSGAARLGWVASYNRLGDTKSNVSLRFTGRSIGRQAFLQTLRISYWEPFHQIVLRT